jgi:iron complex outermembrane receptor protein
VRFFTNAVDTRTEGVDVLVSYATPIDYGDLKLSVAYNRAATDVRRLAVTTAQLAAIDPTLALVGVEEINTLEDATPKDKLILTGTLAAERWDLTARVSRFGSAVRVFNFGGGFEPRQEYGAETQLDLDWSYRANNSLSFVVGVANLLDEYPDLSSADINFFGNLPYDILSPVGVNGRFVYARLRWQR